MSQQCRLSGRQGQSGIPAKTGFVQDIDYNMDPNLARCPLSYSNAEQMPCCQVLPNAWQSPCHIQHLLEDHFVYSPTKPFPNLFKTSVVFAGKSDFQKVANLVAEQIPADYSTAAFGDLSKLYKFVLEYKIVELCLILKITPREPQTSKNAGSLDYFDPEVQALDKRKRVTKKPTVPVYDPKNLGQAKSNPDNGTAARSASEVPSTNRSGVVPLQAPLNPADLGGITHQILAPNGGDYRAITQWVLPRLGNTLPLVPGVLVRYYPSW
ncbi:hypothetical protein EV360DRAFT_76416 [Lentinula raphanica]|nr:hypothetical protein EV360DRAFT_76416 [Lentinula raphanica]